MTIRPDFVFEPDRQPTPCNICGGPIETWHLTTFISAVPVESICADCATAVFKVIVDTPATHEGMSPNQRRHIAQAFKASVTNEAVKQIERDNATAKRLLT